MAENLAPRASINCNRVWTPLDAKPADYTTISEGWQMAGRGCACPAGRHHRRLILVCRLPPFRV